MPTSATRWGRTPLSFGPILVVGWPAAGGASATGLWFFMGWFIAATLVLRQTWQKIRLEPDEAPGPGARLASRFPTMSASIDGTVVKLTLAVLGAIVAVVVYAQGDTLGRFGLVVIGVMAAVSALLVWLTGV